MIVEDFVTWFETAGSRQRADGVRIMAEGLVEGRLSADQRRDVLSLLTLVLDDPSPKVRLALAEVLAGSSEAPRHVILGLGEDIEEIAALVAGASPVLTDADLVDLAATRGPRLRTAVASRTAVSSRVAAALAEVGEATACAALLRNGGAAIAAISHRRIAERHGEDGTVRSLQLARADVPADVRQILVLQLGAALAASPLVAATLGGTRARRLVGSACERATAALAERLRAGEMPALVEHLRLSGQISTAFLIRVACAGNVDLFAAALAALSGRSARRVRAIVVDGREPAFTALVTACGLPAAAGPLLRMAVQVWKQAVTGRQAPDLQAVAADVMRRLVAAYGESRDGAGLDPVASLLNRLEAETLGDRARQQAYLRAA